MTSRVRNILLKLCLFILCATCLMFVACGSKTVNIYNAEGALVFSQDCKQIEIEFGDAYALPQNVQIGGKKTTPSSVALYFNGEQVKLAYGAYQFKRVGEYQVKYTVDGKEYTYTITCVDTVPPEITVVNQTYYAVEGESVPLPKCSYADLAGIDLDKTYMSVSDPDGMNVVIDNDGFSVTKLGNYTVKVIATDKNGVVAEKSVTIVCKEKYIDEDRNDKILYNFDNEKYLELLVSISKKSQAQYAIVKSGYPEIEDEADDNGVLAVTSGSSWENVNTEFLLHEDLLANTGYKIVVKLAVSQHVDYIKLFRDKNDLSDKGLVSQRFGLEPGIWYEWEIDPIAYGYYTEFKNFVISYRDIGGTILFIDEIYFTAQKFTDDLDDNVLADFDEEGYLHNVYQNVYCNPTTTRTFRTTGTTFSILNADDSSVPAANGANASCPGLAPDGGVLKLVTSAPYGGMTYMFQEKLDLNTITRLTFRLYFKLPILSGGVKKTTIITFGFFNQYGYDAGSVHWIDASTKFSVNEWFEFDFSAEELKEHTSDGNITGFYIQIIPHETTAEEYIYQQTLYIDEIYATPKNSVSEQNDNVIASFSNNESLNNVAKDSLNKTAEIGWVNEKYGREGVLQVKSASRSGYSDGFRYIFDETLEVSEDAKVLLPIAIEDIGIKAIDVSVVGKTTARITSFTLDDSFVKKFKTVYFTGKDIIEITNGNYVNEIAIRIQATKKSDTNVLYLDGISLYDVTKDTDKPYFDEISVQNVEILSGETVDISLLNIPVIDDSDPDPRLSVEKLSDANGADITNEIVDGKFAPAASGNYTLTVSAIDAAGNAGKEPVDVTIAVELYSNKADYYDALLQFNSEGSKVLVTSGGKVKFVNDTDSEGNAIKAVQATTTHTGSTTTPFTINLGGQYKVSEIAGIQVTYKIESGKNGAWLGIYVNEKMSDYSADRVASITYKEEKTPVYVTKTITQKDLLTKLDKTDPVTALSIIDKDNNADDRTYTIRIDSIKIIRFSESLLEFNSEESKVLVTSGGNVSLVDDANATDGKAMQAKATHTSSSATPFTINLGGKYKVSEVASIQVRYRITVGESGKIMGFYLNEINDYSSDRVASKTYSPMENYETVTITQDTMLKNGLETDAYLSTLSLIAKDYADFTICIDSITINLI